MHRQARFFILTNLQLRFRVARIQVEVNSVSCAAIHLPPSPHDWVSRRARGVVVANARLKAICPTHGAYLQLEKSESRGKRVWACPRDRCTYTVRHICPSRGLIDPGAILVDPKDLSYCPACQCHVPPHKWKYHSTYPSLSHRDNANELERIAGGKA
jgi:hypothetical protein